MSQSQLSLFDSFFEATTTPTPDFQPSPVEVNVAMFSQPTATERVLSRDFFRYASTDVQAAQRKTFNKKQAYTTNIAILTLLVDLLQNQRQASTEEKQLLARYKGLGGLSELLLERNAQAPGWSDSTREYFPATEKIIDLLNKIGELTSTDPFESAKASILTAFYTPLPIIEKIWAGVEAAGFTGGKVLEPSCGSGRFLGMMPESLLPTSNVTGFELDIVSSLIATHLYPDAKIINGGFEDFAITPSSYDLVISNIPFGDFPVYDPQLNAKGGIWKKSMNRIHNYFFGKSIDVVRPGGMIAFLTSSHLLDAEGNEAIRTLIDDYCDFVGAFRLSSEAFSDEGTSVVTDLVILRKKQQVSTPDISQIAKLVTLPKNHYNPAKGIQDVTINEYFNLNPHLVFGKEIQAGGMFSADNGYRIPGAVDVTKLGLAITERAARFPLSNTPCEKETTILVAAKGRMAINSIVKHESDYYQVVGKARNSNMMVLELITRTPPKNELPLLDAYLQTRDLYYTVLQADAQGIGANAERTLLKAGLDTLARLAKPARFENLVNGRGVLNIILQNEPDFYSVSCLYNEDGTYLPVVYAPIADSEAHINLENLTPADALAYSFNKYGRLNMGVIRLLLKAENTEAAIDQLGTLVMRTPDGVIERNEYLSGNVTEKLVQAQEWAKANPELYNVNVEELIKIQPEPLATTQITFQLGASWVPLEIYQEFLNSVFGVGNMTVEYVSSNDSYIVTSELVGGEFEAITPDGSERRTPDVVVKAAFTKEIPMFYKTFMDGSREIKIALPELTQAVRDKAELLQGAFESLVNTDQVMGEKLTTLYNTLFNCYVPRVFDGQGLTFPGMGGKTFKPHQKDGSMMIIRNMGGMLDHCVGAGKTLILTCTPIRMRQMGLIKKAVVTTLKSVIPDMVKQVKTQYPLARILAPTEKDFQTHNRHRLFAKIASSEWDLIILSHENISLIPFPSEFLTAQYQDQIRELESVPVEDKRMARTLEKKKLRLMNRLAELSDKGKGSSRFNWKELGIDFLLVDESQQFKNLSFETHLTNVSGLGNAKGSRRASNLLLAARYMQELHKGDKGLVLASGTPISNSLVEVFTILKYLSPSLIRRLNFNSIDQFIKSFALITSQLEKNVAGVIKPKTRLTKFVNVTELATFYAMIADIRASHNLVLPRPEIAGGKPELILIPQSESQLRITDAIFRASKTKTLEPLTDLGIHFNGDAEKAIGLVLTGIGTKASIDIRLVFPHAERDGGKIPELVKIFLRIYEETASIKGTQLIFCDLGTPKSANAKPGTRLIEELIETKGEEFINEFSRASEIANLTNWENAKEKLVDVFDLSEEDAQELIYLAQEDSSQFSVYQEVKDQLMENGIPEHEIAFIHDANTVKKKEVLFEAVCRGQIRCCIGSTQKMGTGTNVQTRVVAMHHLDLGWRPSDQEQRNGRGIRQGNMNSAVAIYYYGTEQTIDAYRFGLVAKKQAGIDSFRSGSRGVREMDFEDGESMTMSEFEAAISGDNRILTLEKLKQARQKISNRVNSIGRANALRTVRINHAQKRFDTAKLRLTELDEFVPALQNSITVKEMLEVTRALNGKEETRKTIVPVFTGEVNYETFNTANKKQRESFFAQLIERIKNHYSTLGSIGDINIKADYSSGHRGVEIFLEMNSHEEFKLPVFANLVTLTIENLTSGFTRIFNKLKESEEFLYESLTYNKRELEKYTSTPELVIKAEDQEKIQEMTLEINTLEAELMAEAKANAEEEKKGQSQERDQMNKAA